MIPADGASDKFQSELVKCGQRQRGALTASSPALESSPARRQ